MTKAKTAKQNEMGRQFILTVTKDGAVFARDRRDGACPYGGLPVFSTDTREEAESLIVRHCRLERDASGIYRLNEFSGEIEDLDRVSALFRQTLADRQKRKATKNN